MLLSSSSVPVLACSSKDEEPALERQMYLGRCRRGQQERRPDFLYGKDIDVSTLQIVSCKSKFLLYLFCAERLHIIILISESIPE